jgi:phage gpG-like protein
MSIQGPKIPFEMFLENFRAFKMGRWPRMVGRLALAVFDENFDNGGFTDKVFIRWKPRKGDTDNRGRRLGDGGRQQGRAILIKTGALRRSIRIGWALPHGVNIVAGNQDVPYAGIHNEGGRITGTVSVKSFERKSKTGLQMVKAHTRTQNTTMPRRQFIGNSAKLMDRVSRRFFTEMNQLWLGS